MFMCFEWKKEKKRHADIINITILSTFDANIWPLGVSTLLDT